LEAVPVEYAISPDGFKDCFVQQLIFGPWLQFATEQPEHFAQLNSKLSSLGEYVFSPAQSAVEV